VNTAVKSAAAPVQAWWRSLAERERRLVVVASAVLVVGVVWALLVQPAWRTLSRAPAELDRLETQLQTMQQLAAETQQLRAAPPITPDEASAALNAATARLGNRATLTLTGVGSGALRDWLTEARAGARAKPIEANLTRATQGYSGSLVLTVGGAAP
jgi:general secretion pathway protein M